MFMAESEGNFGFLSFVFFLHNIHYHCTRKGLASNEYDSGQGQEENGQQRLLV